MKWKMLQIEIKYPGTIMPGELKKLNNVDFNEFFGGNVIISGRGPIWLYGYLVHTLHPCRMVAVFDPRLGGIVVASHTPEFQVGDVIKLEDLENLEKIELVLPLEE